MEYSSLKIKANLIRVSNKLSTRLYIVLEIKPNTQAVIDVPCVNTVAKSEGRPFKYL